MSYQQLFRPAALLAASVLLTPVAYAATITWDGGGDGVSTFQEANWQVTDDSGNPALAGLVGMDPPGGFVDPSTDVGANVVISGSATAGGSAGGPHFDLGDGFSMVVQDDATYRGRFFGTPPGGIRGVAGGATETLAVSDTADVIAQFLLDIEATFSGSSTMTFGGGGTGTFAGSTTVDLASDWTGSFEWVNFGGVSGSSIIGKITVGGAPAIEGVNVLVTSNGSGGAVLTRVPEPATQVVGAIAVAAFGVRRRRCSDSREATA